MPTTTKMGIVYPASTDLVKDGATNMGTIATTIDAKSGLVLLNTTSFSGSSSQSVNNVFSTNFTNYLILLNCTHAIAGDIFMKLRASGTDATSNYANQRIFGFGTTLVTSTNTTTAQWPINIGSGVGTKVSRIELFSPFVAVPTRGLCQFFDQSVSFTGIFGMANSNSTSYDGFTIAPDTGTITGDVTVYGFNK
jgi:hypothetical protein